MKIVIPVGALHVGGGCRVLADTANALHRRGHDTEIVIPEAMPIEYKLECKVTKVPSLSKEFIPYGDIVLPNFYTTFAPSFEAWPTRCVRFSLGFEPYWVPDSDYAISTYAHGVPTISISHWLDDQIYAHVQQRGAVVNLGVNRLVFHSSRKKRRNQRRIILYVARDPKAGYQLKGYHDFLAAMKIFKRKYKGKFTVYMICPERVLPLPGIPHRCFVPKNDKEMARLYRKADVFVSTSWFEGFALPPLEAMSCGTPVVTTNSGGILDFCEHKKSAYIVPPHSPHLLAHGINRVLSDTKLASQLRHGGLRSARSFTKRNFEKRIVKAIEDIYKTTANGSL